MRPTLYKTTNGQSPIEYDTDFKTLAALWERLGDRIATDSYTEYRDDGTEDYEVWEVYGEGETESDYPDGDPYADSIHVPIEYAYVD